MYRRRAKVMPTNPQKNYQGGGITLEDLKAQTYRRLAEEEGNNIESSSHNVALKGQKHSTASMNANYPRHHPHHPRFQQPREQQQYAPVQHYGSPHNRYPHPRGPMNYGHPPPPNFGGGYAYDVHHHHQPNPCYEQTSRNYTDSQLGLKGGNGSRSQQQQAKNKNMQQPISLPITHQQHLSSPPPPNYYPNPQPLQQQQQQYSTPRMPRHAAVLKDRGSAENSSVGSDQPTNINGGSSSYGYENRGNARPTPSNSRAALLYKGTTAAAATTTSGKQPQRSPVNGRFTPTREHHLESQVLFATPNQRRDAVPSTPSSCYSEPPRSKPVGNNYTRIKSPVHAPPARAQDAQQQKQLPAHGLTVHELKEMTRARLAERREQQGRLATGAEDIPGGVSGGEGLSSDQSVQSVGTHGSTKSGPCKLSNEPVTRNLLQSNDSVRYQGQQQMHNIPQYNNYPRHPSPEFGTTAGGKEPQFNGFNRGRCFSAEATTGVPSSSFEQHQASYYDNVPLTGTANRQRCATVSPPGMSRLHEDRPFLFSKDDKDRLAIPPLSEPRMRLHSTGGLNTNGTAVRAFSSSVSPPPTEGAVTVSNGGNKANEEFQLLSPPATVNLTSPSTMNRSKFSANDRTISTGSTASGLGDLPSSMAEAVLESLTSANAPKMSPFRSSEQGFVGESPYRVSGESSDNSSSAFRLPGLAESSGSMSLFSSGEPQNIFVPSDKSSGDDRMLLGTHSWGGADDEGGLSHDFSNLLNFAADDNIGAPPARTRAVTEPSWIGESGRSLVSRIDPEVNDERKAPPHRVSSDNAGR